MWQLYVKIVWCKSACRNRAVPQHTLCHPEIAVGLYWEYTRRSPTMRSDWGPLEPREIVWVWVMLRNCRWSVDFLHLNVCKVKLRGKILIVYTYIGTQHLLAKLAVDIYVEVGKDFWSCHSVPPGLDSQLHCLLNSNSFENWAWRYWMTTPRILGRFPFNGLTGQTQIVFLCINGKIWSMFLKYLVKMDLIQMLSKISGQIGPKPKCFVFHSTIWPFLPC
jgi:hypothetical protein